MLKYIIVRNRDSGKEEVFLFPKSVNHDVFAKSVGRLKNQAQGQWRRITRDIVAAGFVSPSFKCYGGSDTLHMVSREQDTKILRGT